MVGQELLNIFLKIHDLKIWPDNFKNILKKPWNPGNFKNILKTLIGFV